MQLPQPLLCPMGQHQGSREVRRSWYPRCDLPQHPALGAGFGQWKAAGQGDPLPFQTARLGSRRVNPSQSRGMRQKNGQGRPRGAWGSGQFPEHALFSRTASIPFQGITFSQEARGTSPSSPCQAMVLGPSGQRC